MDSTFNLNDYTLLETIGKGTFGIIRKAIRNENNELVAIKIVDKSKLSEKDKRAMSQECELLTELKHPNILEVYTYGRDSDNFYCVMPLYKGGDLEKFTKEKPLSKVNTFRVFSQLLDAVEYLHDNNIIHRDIKLENIFISNVETMEIVLADFGFWARQNIGGNKLTDHVGTPLYSAPEIAAMSDPYDGRPVDMWAVGVSLSMMLTRKYPFPALNMDQLRFKLLLKPPSYAGIEQGFCRKLLFNLFNKDPKFRYNVSQVRSSMCYTDMMDFYKYNKPPSYTSSNKSPARSPKRSPIKSRSKSPSLKRSPSRSPTRSSNRNKTVYDSYGFRRDEDKSSDKSPTPIKSRSKSPGRSFKGSLVRSPDRSPARSSSRNRTVYDSDGFRKWG